MLLFSLLYKLLDNQQAELSDGEILSLGEIRFSSDSEDSSTSSLDL
jgi:hypothetical protein